jgi:hypothetical protein
MHCIKWICSSQPFGSIESITATRTNLDISTFQSSMPSLTIQSSFACLENDTTVQVDDDELIGMEDDIMQDVVLGTPATNKTLNTLKTGT